MESKEGNWEEFQDWLRELRSRNYRRTFAFRGQGDSEWRLETTLERNGHPTMQVADYYDMAVRQVGPQVSSFTSMQVPLFDQNLWNMLSDYDRYKMSLLDQTAFPGGASYEYTAYLRHHGFPSPLLDWSQSPYVAAFFAFRQPAPTDGKRAIYVYCDRPLGVHNWLVGVPAIDFVIGQTPTPRRHFLQQSIYTMCVSAEDYKWKFDSHQKVFDHPNPEQDFLWKFEIPSTERKKILGLLDEYNLNAYSLFGSDESLLETLWLRESRS